MKTTLCASRRGALLALVLRVGARSDERASGL